MAFTIAVGRLRCIASHPQPQSYHDFADQRGWLGIHIFGNVASNLLFAVAGAWGLILLCRKSEYPRFIDPRERWAYVFVFLGLLLTAFGSSYYHLAPDNARLVWDRLPMTFAFMGLVSALISERLSVPVGFYLLPILLLIGLAASFGGGTPKRLERAICLCGGAGVCRAHSASSFAAAAWHSQFSFAWFFVLRIAKSSKLRTGNFFTFSNWSGAHAEAGCGRCRILDFDATEKTGDPAR